jgi:hypothetical protein
MSNPARAARLTKPVPPPVTFSTDFVGKLVDILRIRRLTH